MAVQGLDAAFDAIIQDCQAIALEAVKDAAKKAQKDILKQSYRYMAKYYANYRPKVYKRTKNLHRAITPVFEDRSSAAGISIEVGVEYNSGLLKGYYCNSRFHQSGDVWKVVTDYSHVTGDNGIPEPDWILDNFLEGVHPWAQTDGESTNSLMEEFFDNELPKHISGYVQEALFAAITSRL